MGQSTSTSTSFIRFSPYLPNKLTLSHAHQTMDSEEEWENFQDSTRTQNPANADDINCARSILAPFPEEENLGNNDGWFEKVKISQQNQNGLDHSDNQDPSDGLPQSNPDSFIRLFSKEEEGASKDMDNLQVEIVEDINSSQDDHATLNNSNSNHTHTICNDQSSSYLRRRKNQGTKPFVCLFCRKLFYRAREWEGHLYAHLNLIAKIRAATRANAAKIVEKSSSTNYQTVDKVALEQHNHLEIQEKSRKIINPQIQPPKSKTPSPRPGSGSGSHQCGKCGKFFSRNWSLIRHDNAVHLGLKQFPCPNCEKRFLTKGLLNLHINAVHIGTRYPCSKCDKTYSYPHDARRHEKEYH